MNRKHFALKLFFDALGLSTDVTTVEQRKLLQKAVYLGQVAGADLGYRFGWHVHGPYSSALADDYYELHRSPSADSDETALRLPVSYQEALSALRPVLTPPSSAVDQPTWLELLASYHYLRRVSRLAEAEADVELAKRKSHLTELLPNAKRVIAETQQLRVS